MFKFSLKQYFREWVALWPRVDKMGWALFVLYFYLCFLVAEFLAKKSEPHLVRLFGPINRWLMPIITRWDWSGIGALSVAGSITITMVLAFTAMATSSQVQACLPITGVQISECRVIVTTIDPADGSVHYLQVDEPSGSLLQYACAASDTAFLCIAEENPMLQLSLNPFQTLLGTEPGTRVVSICTKAVPIGTRVGSANTRLLITIRERFNFS